TPKTWMAGTSPAMTRALARSMWVGITQHTGYRPGKFMRPHWAPLPLHALPRPESIRQGFVVPPQNFGPPPLGRQFGLPRLHAAHAPSALTAVRVDATIARAKRVLRLVIIVSSCFLEERDCPSQVRRLAMAPHRHCVGHHKNADSRTLGGIPFQARRRPRLQACATANGSLRVGCLPAAGRIDSAHRFEIERNERHR